jgi:hypothetical protein
MILGLTRILSVEYLLQTNNIRAQLRRFRDSLYRFVYVGLFVGRA